MLTDTMVIHAGHRPGLERFHTREIHLVRLTEEGPATTQEQQPSAMDVFLRGLRRLVGSS